MHIQYVLNLKMGVLVAHVLCMQSGYSGVPVVTMWEIGEQGGMRGEIETVQGGHPAQSELWV